MSRVGPVLLYQFAFSHYNEKVRWALDYKGIASERRSLLPGFHERTIRALSGGPTTTPLLCDGDLCISGSTAILEHLEATRPAPPLFPAEDGARKEAGRWIHWLDEEIGPAVRLALFHVLLADTGYASRIFTADHSGPKAIFYRALFPGLVPMLRRRMAIDPENASLAGRQVEAGLERIARASERSGYLVGGEFSAADLSAAALFFPLFFPAQIPFALPDRESAVFDAWLARWRDEPGIAYLREIWTRHRQSA